MIAQPQHQQLTPQEYLEWEEQQPIKYEYINGEVFAMTGGTLPHNSIAVNLTSALKNHLRGKGCKVFMADAKVGVSLQGPFHYPDVMVSCDLKQRTDVGSRASDCSARAAARKKRSKMGRRFGTKYPGKATTCANLIFDRLPLHHRSDP